MLNLAARLQAVMSRSNSYSGTYELAGSFSCTPFKERFENNLSGLSCDFTVNLSNNMTKC